MVISLESREIETKAFGRIEPQIVVGRPKKEIGYQIVCHSPQFFSKCLDSRGTTYKAMANAWNTTRQAALQAILSRFFQDRGNFSPAN
jgi:hypothetical protein